MVGRGRGGLRKKWAHGGVWVPSRRSPSPPSWALHRDTEGAHCGATASPSGDGWSLTAPHCHRHFGGQDGILAPRDVGMGCCPQDLLGAALLSGDVVPPQCPERGKSWEGFLKGGGSSGNPCVAGQGCGDSLSHLSPRWAGVRVEPVQPCRWTPGLCLVPAGSPSTPTSLPTQTPTRVCGSKANPRALIGEKNPFPSCKGMGVLGKGGARSWGQHSQSHCYQGASRLIQALQGLQAEGL